MNNGKKNDCCLRIGCFYCFFSIKSDTSCTKYANFGKITFLLIFLYFLYYSMSGAKVIKRFAGYNPLSIIYILLINA